MKNSKYLLALFTFSTILCSCEPDELLNETQYQNTDDIYATNGDQKDVIDTGEEDSESTSDSGDQKDVIDTGEEGDGE